MSTRSKRPKPTNLLIDADVVCYQASAVSESKVDWEDGSEPTTHGNLKLAKEAFDSILARHQKDTKIDDFVMCWTVGENYRKAILPTYKESRKGKPKPIDYSDLKEWAMAKYPADYIETLEADDVMGIRATQEPGRHIIVSIDKDMAGIPGWFYRVKPGKFGTPILKKITPIQAQSFFLLQVLMGDKSDNYDGVPGIGPKKAEAWLATHGYTWESIVACYNSKGRTEEDAIIQARCAKILENKQYRDGNLRMWEPSDLIKT